jgi:tellurite resistance protein TehA-like permease
MYPGYFALVMATGILSNAFLLLEAGGISQFLFWVNLVAYPILIGVTLARAIWFRRELWADLINPESVFTFFTFVAGTNVLGIQCFLRHYEVAARALWLVALITWVIFGYFSFAVLTIVNTPRGVDVVNGGWLIGIVATQSLVVLGTFLAPGWGGSLAPLAFFAIHCLWGIGIALYGVFIALFSHRIFFARLEPTDANPLFWVVMGAAAISTNAGSALIRSTPILPFLTAMRPFMDGATLILWAWSTWWIPLLTVLGVWRHAVRKVPVTYLPANWSIVFPLGMYSVATYRLSLASDAEFLRAISRVMIWVAMGAWSLTMLGLVRSLVRTGLRDLGAGAAPGVLPGEAMRGRAGASVSGLPDKT